ncbi:hypothetical protein PhaeoP30_02450 [Phaeobacter inhibens]|nr:hypothetical protein PhaeoP30_02450 [Phaeobacter inhibens]AUQ63413.1 hypothetical protein PhaeoP51_02451 [Phaeobacter inhibens]AUQ83319.1 hypothetical protein PhaeoP57_02412 [Phaeobacter inhibens]AUQ91078.1 hypothetical protein PhaeoP24_02484 [Phaeobacter inhibens]
MGVGGLSVCEQSLPPVIEACDYGLNLGFVVTACRGLSCKKGGASQEAAPFFVNTTAPAYWRGGRLDQTAYCWGDPSLCATTGL